MAELHQEDSISSGFTMEIKVPTHFHVVTMIKFKQINFGKEYCRTTLESLLNQFNSGNSHLSRRTCSDN